MSSGQGSYRVVSAQELERRRVVAAEARFRRACEEVARVEEDIAAAARAFGDVDITVPRVVPPRGASAAAVEAAAGATEAAARVAAAGYEGAVSRARSQAIAGSITKAKRSKFTDTAAAERAERIAAADATAQARQAREAEQLRWVEERQTEVGRVLGRLPADVDAVVIEQARQHAEAALDAVGDDAAYARAVEELRMEVQQVQDADRARRANVALVERLRAQLDGLEGADVEAAQRRLDAVDPRGPLPPDLDGEIGRVAAVARAERDRSFVLGAVAETLDELGYGVGAGFATAVVEDGAVVRLPWSDQHGLRVRDRSGHLLFNVVRYDDGAGAGGDVVADMRAEDRFCQGYPRLVALARQHGCAIDLAPPTPAGQQPLQHVPLPRDIASSRAADRDLHAERDRARQRERKA